MTYDGRRLMSHASRKALGRSERTKGFSLVELMVAITVSMILMAGIIQLLVGNKQAYRLQEGFSRLNENARFAVREVTHKLHMGGHWGGVSTGDVSANGGLPAVNNDCTHADWVAFSNTGIEGYEGIGTSPMETCIPDANYLPGSDIVVVRYADAGNVLSAEATSAPRDTDVYVRAEVGRRAEIVQGVDIDSLSDLYDATDPDAPGMYNYPYRIFAYFVRSCSMPGPDGVCDTGDDVGDGIPTLVRLGLSGTALVEEGVVEGVEQLQITYGVNTDGDVDATADRYLTADNVLEWDDVVSVRFGILVRNPEVDVGVNDTDSYAMPGGFNYTPPLTDQIYARQLFTHVIQIRNRTRS